MPPELAIIGENHTMVTCVLTSSDHICWTAWKPIFAFFSWKHKHSILQRRNPTRTVTTISYVERKLSKKDCSYRVPNRCQDPSVPIRHNVGLIFQEAPSHCPSRPPTIPILPLGPLDRPLSGLTLKLGLRRLKDLKMAHFFSKILRHNAGRFFRHTRIV